jgi:hypothetical protein
MNHVAIHSCGERAYTCKRTQQTMFAGATLCFVLLLA